jgi:hypothetical protein
MEICEQHIVWTGCKRPVERPFIIALRGTNLFGLYHIVCKIQSSNKDNHRKYLFLSNTNNVFYNY